MEKFRRDSRISSIRTILEESNSRLFSSISNFSRSSKSFGTLKGVNKVKSEIANDIEFDEDS